MPAEVIDGRKIAKEIRNRISQEVVILKSKHKSTPNIATIKIGSDPSSELYLKLRDKACNEVGIRSIHKEFSSKVSESKVIDEIRTLNNDEKVHGILIQFPVPEHITPRSLLNAIDPKKDVEGFHPYNMGRTLIGDEHIIPCTSKAVLTILEYKNTKLKGKDAVIVNHSMVVGKPLATLFLNRDATVSVSHVFTKNLKQYTCKAEILVTAAGVPKLITKDHVKEGAFVIDVGIIQTEDGICGDVDFENVKEKAGKITPVPGGVGPVTIACSLQNMLITFKNCMK